ncbi:MAG TPA: MazG nucleotide pyrophosphohydrolase domain-containing protein [Polyangia bacterium]|nr:MazG nucleotide pyrophosphohydrolase domain-containing protein [Polyangia bacterium]
MQRLLAPDGCPWDREQTLETLVPYLVEETYEVVDALAGGDADDHREELGDLLLQIVFQSELRFAEGKFGIDDVARGIVAKLVHRHPHVFDRAGTLKGSQAPRDEVDPAKPSLPPRDRAGTLKGSQTPRDEVDPAKPSLPPRDLVEVKDADDVLSNWAKLKAKEKAAKGKHGALDGVPRSAPALLRATRTGEKAGAVGFDWPDADGPRAKVDEELRELDEARGGGDRARMQAELGDLLFATVNLARKLELDAEQALRDATDRFARRFGHLERTLAAEGRAVADAPPDEQDRLWEAAKRAEAEVPAPDPKE